MSVAILVAAVVGGEILLIVSECFLLEEIGTVAPVPGRYDGGKDGNFDRNEQWHSESLCREAAQTPVFSNEGNLSKCAMVCCPKC